MLIYIIRKGMNAIVMGCKMMSMASMITNLTSVTMMTKTTMMTMTTMIAILTMMHIAASISLYWKLEVVCQMRALLR